MKIFYIAPLEKGNIHTERWIRYFADIGHEVYLIASDVPQINIANIKARMLRRFGPHSPIISHLVNSVAKEFQFRKLIKTLKPDIIHAHYIMRATLLAAASGFHPFVVTVWGSDILVEPKKSKISRYIVKYVLRKADLITCDGENVKKAMINLGVSPSKIKIIYFGVDTEKFTPGPKDEELKNKLEISNSPVVISLRRLEPLYNVQTLIECIPFVFKEVPHAKFIIAGKGSQKEYLVNLAKSLNVCAVTKFIGQISHDEVPRYLNLSDIYVSTSLSDGGIAISTVEAMACRLPVVITDSADNEKWVKNGENGFIFSLKNSKVLAEKIIFLLKNENIRKKMGKLNQKAIEEKNNYYKEMTKMENIYKEFKN